MYDPFAAIDDPIQDLLAAQQGLTTIANPALMPLPPGGGAATQGAPALAQPQAMPIGQPIQPALAPQPAPVQPGQGALAPSGLPPAQHSSPLGRLFGMNPTAATQLRHQQAVAKQQENQQAQYMANLTMRAAQGDPQAQQELQRRQALLAPPVKPTAEMMNAQAFAQNPEVMGAYYGARYPQKPGAQVNVNMPEPFRPFQQQIALDQYKDQAAKIENAQDALELMGPTEAILRDIWRSGGETGGAQRLMADAQKFLGLEGASSMEALESQVIENALVKLQSFSGPTTDFEYGIAQNAGVTLDNSSKGNFMKLRLAQHRARRQAGLAIDKQAFLSETQGRGTEAQFREWRKVHGTAPAQITVDTLSGWSREYDEIRNPWRQTAPADVTEWADTVVED